MPCTTIEATTHTATVQNVVFTSTPASQNEATAKHSSPAMIKVRAVCGEAPRIERDQLQQVDDLDWREQNDMYYALAEE